MGSSLNTVLLVVIAIGAIVYSSLFTVDEREHAIKLQFGEVKETGYDPGLYLKIPFVNNVRKFSNQILTYDSPTEPFLTEEKKNLRVDYFVTWRIIDPRTYYVATGGDEDIAINRLTAIIKEGIKAQFGRRTVQQVVSAERSELLDEMLVQASDVAKELGLEVVDVRLKRIDLADDVSDSVYDRMRQERARVAKQLRAEGDENAEKIRAEADRESTVILANAYREAEEIRGAGDSRAAEIYAEAFDKNRDFYAFYRSMESYRKAMGQERDVLVLRPDSEFFRFLNEREGSAR